MTRHIQDPRETLYAESVCGENAIYTGGTWSRAVADCARCIGIYDQQEAAKQSRNRAPFDNPALGSASSPVEGVSDGDQRAFVTEYIEALSRSAP